MHSNILGLLYVIFFFVSNFSICSITNIIVVESQFEGLGYFKFYFKIFKFQIAFYDWSISGKQQSFDFAFWKGYKGDYRNVVDDR